MTWDNHLPSASHPHTVEQLFFIEWENKENANRHFSRPLKWIDTEALEKSKEYDFCYKPLFIWTVTPRGTQANQG